jgi:hypothetical protein
VIANLTYGHLTWTEEIVDRDDPQSWSNSNFNYNIMGNLCEDSANKSQPQVWKELVAPPSPTPSLFLRMSLHERFFIERDFDLTDLLWSAAEKDRTAQEIRFTKF